MIKPETTVLPLSILTVTSIVTFVGYIKFEVGTVENVFNEMYNGINTTSIERLKQMDLRNEKCKTFSNSVPTVKCTHCISVIITVYNEPADVLAATIQSLVREFLIHIFSSKRQLEHLG